MKTLKHSVGLLLIGVLLNFAAAAEPMKGEPFISGTQLGAHTLGVIPCRPARLIPNALMNCRVSGHEG